MRLTLNISHTLLDDMHPYKPAGLIPVRLLLVPLQIASTHQSKYFRCYHCTENGAYKNMQPLENYERICIES